MATLTKKEKSKIAADLELKNKNLKLKNKKTTSKEDDLAILKNATRPKAEQKKKEEIILPKEEIKEEIKTDLHTEFKNSLAPETGEIKNDPVQEIKKAEEIKEEIKPEIKPDAIPEKRKLSLWEDIVKPTNEDAGIKEQAKETFSAVSNLADDASALTENISDMESEELAKKQSYKVKAGIAVELAGVGFMVVCLLLTWNFNDENQIKFTLNKPAKDAIKYNLSKVYEMEGKKLNPKKDIMFLIIGSYVPMLLVAVMIMINNLKSKSEAKKNKAAFNFQQSAAQKELQDMKQQLAAEKYQRDILEKELSFATGSRDIIKDVDRQFINTPALGKTKKIPVKKESGRGVQKGVKRGSYNKNK